MKVISKLYYAIRVKIAIGLLKNLDDSMKKAGWSRQQRRAFWREVARSQEAKHRLVSTLSKGVKT